MNKNLFSTKKTAAAADTVNAAGGRAYSVSDEQALAQYAVTGTLNGVYYASAEAQLQEVLKLADRCSPRFVAQTAVYARTRGFMKDVPALLVAHVATRDLDLFKAVFPVVIDDFKMLRNFVQVVRSGVTGRKSLGTALKTQVKKFLESRTDDEIFAGSIGNDPSLADIIRMVHPTPKTVSRANLYAYLLGRTFKIKLLPDQARGFELFKNNPSGHPPEVNFQLLSNISMSKDQWAALAQTMSWHTLRMNLNTLNRNKVFDIKGMDTVVANRLRDPESIRKLKLFPYQLLAAYMNAVDVPVQVRNALQDAMELATKNVPEFPGRTVVAVDTSGSMGSPITGNRGSVSTTIRCVDVAGLIAATILRRNGDALIMPFDTRVHGAGSVNARDSIVTNAEKLARFGGGGTDCASVLRKLNQDKTKADLVFYVSDNESWVQSSGRYGSYYGAGTDMAGEWLIFRRRCPGAKLICLDLVPNSTVQVRTGDDVLNIGGFSDKVFEVVASFCRGDFGTDTFVKTIKDIEI